MKIINDNIKNALKQPTTQRKGRILVGDNYYEVYNVEYFADAYNEGNVIGNAIASQLDFDLPYMEKFEKFEYYDGVWTGNEYEYVYMGEFTVFDEQDEDEFNKHITAFDNLIKFNVPFKALGTYPKTLYQELENVCEQAEITLLNTNISNGNFILENNQFVNGESLKTVLKAICQISGNYAIVKNDSLILQLKNKTNEKLDRKDHEPIIWKRKTYGINQVVLGMADIEGEYVLREDLEDISKNGVHKIVINDNPFAYTQEKREKLVDELFEQVRGFGYIPFEMNSEWFNYWEIGDTIILDGIETIILRINGKSPNSLESTISAPAIIDSSIEYVNNTNTIENRMARAEIIVDKNTQEIQSIASKVVDVSNNVSGIGSIQLENAYEGILHKLSIAGNISLLYPKTNEVYGRVVVPSETLTPSEDLSPSLGVPYNADILYPSSELYPKIFKLQVDETVYELDINYLNYMNAEAYDEFVYEDGECYIIRRVGIDENGEMYKLKEEVKEKRKNITINVLKDSIIALLGFSNAIMTATYLTQNQYTDIFASQVEVQSEIKVATDEINIEVAKKVNEDEVVSAINLSPEQISLKSNRLEIESDNFNLTSDGHVQSIAGSIGGWNIENNALWCYIRPPYDYNGDDVNRVQAILNGQITPTQDDYNKYDFHHDGIDARDLLICRKLVIYNIGYNNPGKLLFDTSDWFRPIKILNGYGETLASFGIEGVFTKTVE